MAQAARALSQRLETLREQIGEGVPFSELVEAAEAVISTLEGDLTPGELVMRRELTELSEFMEKARREVAAIRPDEIRDRLPQAKDELDAVVAATEQAAGAFLTAAEDITALADKLGGEAAEELNRIATGIYEASSFQDITGQRITKVIKAIRHVEERIAALAHLTGDSPPTASQAAPPPAPTTDDAHLLQGPQLEGQGNSQEDIDALLASFD